MGFLDKVNKLWSGSDFWDKKENAKQRVQFDEEEKRKKREAQAQAKQKQADIQRTAQERVDKAAAERQKQQPANKTVQDLGPVTSGPLPQTRQVYQPTQPSLGRGTKNGEWGMWVESKATPGKRNFIPDAPGKKDNSLGGHLNRALTTAKDTAVGSVASIPALAPSIVRTGTGIVQGALQTPHMVSAAAATATQELNKHMNNPVTRQINRGFQDINTGVKIGTHYTVDNAFDPINRQIDRVSQEYAKTKVGQMGAADEAYRATQVPLNVLAAVLTLGAATGAQAASATSKGGKLAQTLAALNKPVAGSADDIVSKFGGGAINKLSTTANALNSPLSATRRKVATMGNEEKAFVDTGEANILGNEPVKPDIPEELAPQVPGRPPRTEPAVPSAPEVATGVKAPNLVNGAPEPTPVPAPVVVEKPAATTTKPRTNKVPAQAAAQIEQPQKPVPLEQPPAPVQAVPEATPVATPIREASQEVIDTTAPVVAPEQVIPPQQAPVVPVDEATGGLRATRESLLAERDARIAEGLPTLDLDRQISRVEKLIADKVSGKTPEAQALADGEQQLADAVAPAKPKARANTKPEIAKQEAPKKPKKDDSKNVNLSADELRARGVSEEGIAREMARQAAAEAPKKAPKKASKTSKPEKTDVAQSEKPEPTTVKPDLETQRTEQRAAELKAEETKSTTEPTAWTDEGVADIVSEGKQVGATQKQIDEQVALYKQENPRPKTVAEPEPTPIATAEPVVPKAPTQRQLNKAVTDAPTTKAGKVTAAWKNEQKAAGATDEQIAKAVEKVEGRKVEPTATEKAKSEDRKKTNADAKARKAKAAEEGRDKEAAPNFVDKMAKQKAAEMDESVAYFTKHFGSQVKTFKIKEELAKAYNLADAKDEGTIGQYVKDYLSKVESTDDPLDMFTGMAIVRRLEQLRRAGKLTDEGMLGLADEVYQSSAAKVSKAGQVERIAQEMYKLVPAKTRVAKKLDVLKTKLGEHKLDFEPTKAQTDELVTLTDDFDTAATNMTGLDGELATNLDNYAAATTPEERTALFDKHQELTESYKQAQADTVAASKAFNDSLKGITPELPLKARATEKFVNSPDNVGNYLRMAMLSAPSGRIRDALSTGLNVLDDIPVVATRAIVGRVLNKFTKGNYVDSVGSAGSLKKGAKGGASKIKTSYEGGYTLDEATGKIGTNDRGDLLKKGKNGRDPIETFGVKHSNKGSKWNVPKKLIRTLVQAPTDATFFKYTEELHNLGRVEARARGITDKKQIDQFARMFADSPTKEAQTKAAQKWLSNSGMQDNNISQNLTKLADWLDSKGTPTKSDPLNPKKRIPRSAAAQFGIKATARVVRTTTIPFVQYTGGATHAMFMRQNPVANFGKAGKAAFWQRDFQKVIDEVSRGGWNTVKIGALAYAIDKKWVETSDTDADGKTSYNGPYLVRTVDGKKQYVPASTLGIAGGAALIGAHYVNQFFKNMADGNPVEALTNITTDPIFATVKATGLNNIMSGENVLGGVFANSERVYNDPNKTGANAASTLGAGLVGDIGSQAVPAASRDLNVAFDKNDSLNPTHEKPDTSGKDPVTGKVDPWKKAGAQITAGIPVLSQQLPRKSGEAARDFGGRILNANTQTEQQKAGIEAEKTETETINKRTADVVKDDKISKLMSPETKAIYDKYGGDMSKASKDDRDKVWTDVSAAKDRLLDDGSYDSYSKVLTYERDEAKASGSSTETEIAEMDRDISRAKIASEKKTDPQIFRLYTGTDTPEGGGLSASEFKKMLQLDKDGKPEYPDLYDPKTATLLWELDEAMTKAGVSGNTNGINPWTRNKYNLDEALGRGKYASKGSGSGDKNPGVSTGFGTLGAYAKPPEGAQAQKYKGIDARSPLPNLTAQSSKTNLKKNISVAKGVRL